MAVKILDCTLRDGGYVNDWNFGQDNINTIITNLKNLDIDLIEIGFCKGEGGNPNRAEYKNIHEINTSSIQHNNLVVMVESGYKFDLGSIPESCISKVKMIRIIVWKNSIFNAFEIAKSYLNKGYKICINFTRTDQYTPEELLSLCEEFTSLEIEAFYIVDTFGSMYLEHFIKYSAFLDANLPENICIGIHAHNNLNQANQVAEYYTNIKSNRTYIIDATLSGIGRGAGNVCLELICKYMNFSNNSIYDIDTMLKISQNIIEPIIRNHYSGGKSSFIYSAINNINPEYVVQMDFNKDNVLKKLKNISDDDKVRFNSNSII